MKEGTIVKEGIKNKVDLLVLNRQKVEKEFKWGYSLMNIAAALVFTATGKEADIERLKECREILKKNTGMFSSFQSYSEAVIISKMALSADPEQYIKDVKSIYEVLNKKSFVDNAYLIQGAIAIYEAGRMNEAEMISAKYRELFKKMEKKHPFLTSSSDSIFTVFLVMTDKTVDELFDEMETCYEYAKKELKLKVGSNEIQGLSEILTLSEGDIKEKCDQVARLYETIINHGVKWGKDYNEFASLATLINLNVDNGQLVDEIVEVADFLKSSKGFGNWTLDNKQRLMFAAMLVGDAYAEDSTLIRNSTINSTVAMVIAEEIALLMCIMICTTAANSSTH